MSLNRMLQVLLPQPGDDMRSWASSLVAQLQFLLQQQANDTQMLSSAPATAPLYQSDGNTLVITDVGEYKLADGTVIVDATGLHVKDATGFDVINGPTIRIDTQHLVDAAIETAKLAAGAVTNTIIADNSISTGKLQANSIVAGKIAANAIVAGDGVIANAAIVNAQIADLNASKINAGDIAAERMSTNIVTALTGKFATLSALAASLGVVSIQAGGALLTQGVTTYTSGTGLWTGENGGLYKFRIGNPAGARLDWDGVNLNIYNSANKPVLIAGSPFNGRNLAPSLNLWGVSGTLTITSGALQALDGYILTIPSGQNSIPAVSPTLNLAVVDTNFVISFKAAVTGGSSRTLFVDLFPDTLPESSFTITGTPAVYSAKWTSTHADLASCVLRIFGGTEAANLLVWDVSLSYGAHLAEFTVNQFNKLSASNVSTYMSNATIGTAQIIDANITTAKIADAAIQSAKIGDLQVDTIKIANFAVSTVYFFSQSGTALLTSAGTPVAIIDAGSITFPANSSVVWQAIFEIDNNAGTAAIVDIFASINNVHYRTRVTASPDVKTVSIQFSTSYGSATQTFPVLYAQTSLNSASGQTIALGRLVVTVFKK